MLKKYFEDFDVSVSGSIVQWAAHTAGIGGILAGQSAKAPILMAAAASVLAAVSLVPRK